MYNQGSLSLSPTPRPFHQVRLYSRRSPVSAVGLSLSPTPRPFHQVWLYGRHSPVSAVALSNSAQLQDHFIRYGFMAEIHLFQQWVSLTQPNSKTISSGMALWQKFTCFSCGSQLKSKTISSDMAFFTADITCFSSGSVSLSPNPRQFHQVWLYGRHSAVGLSLCLTSRLFHQV